MNVQDKNIKISEFLAFITPLVCRILKGTFEAFEIAAQQKGQCMETVFHIKSGDKELDFYLSNLLLEIATIDRDEIPLRFDEDLCNYNYFTTKTAKLIDSKLRILFKVLDQDDIDKAIESITQSAKDYERICIVKLDNQQS